MVELIGQRLGRYTVIEQIGKGGMATVYRAHQASVHRDVAVKVLRPSLADRADFAEQLEREAQLVASLKHPYIVKIFDFGQHKNLVYIVMELYSGGSLAKANNQGRLPLDSVGRIVDQIASALEYAHENGVIHRDLKPQNIMLDDQGNAYLADFGISLLLVDTPNITEYGPVVGTPGYIPPEQWRGEPADPQSDIYSLGAVLFEMLTGKPPYASETLHALMHMHIHSPPPSASERVHSIPPGVDKVIATALAKDRTQRYKSALEMAVAFRAAIRGSRSAPATILNRSDTPPMATPAFTRLLDERPISGEQASQQEDAAIALIAAEERTSLGVSSTRRPFIGLLPQDISNRFQGRGKQQAEILNMIAQGARLISIYGRGGVGKTALACKVLADLERATPEARPNGMVYLSASSRDVADQGISLDRILAAFGRLLLGSAGDAAKAVWRDPQLSTAQKVLMLLNELRDGKYLLLLDNLENLQDQETHALTDPDLQLFVELTLERSDNLCLLITSRETLQLARHLQTWENQIALNEGLPLKEAYALLRAFDPSGRAGLRDAPVSKRKIIVERTRGFPRALEAIAGLLLEDPLISLDDLLHNEQLLSGEITSAIVQSAIERLSPTARRVMEALALYGRPVPQVALDFLLAPYIDTSSLHLTLKRLMQAFFVSYNPKSHQFDLHPIDRDYCYACVPQGTPDDRPQSDVAPVYSRYALHWRAAAFYVRLRKPPEEWHSLDDLAPQLAEFEHLTQVGDYDTAVSLLFTFDISHLHLWGHYALAIALHERLQGRIKDPRLARSSLNNVGLTYERVGRIGEAMSCYEVALESARQQHDRRHEGIALGNLANILMFYLGQIESATGLYDQKLGISREMSNRHEESIDLGNLGSAYFFMGQTQRAVDLYQEALGVCKDLADPAWEVMLQANLGEAYIASGKYDEAVGLLRRALDQAVAISDRRGKGYCAFNLACAMLLSGNLTSALDAIVTAQEADLPEINYLVSALHGIILTSLGIADKARKVLTSAVQRARELLENTPGLYPALYACGLARAGLVVMGKDEVSAVVEDLRAAHSICSAPGVLSSNLRLLDALMKCAGGSALEPARNILGG